MYWAVVVLATLVIFLAAGMVVYLIRDARHQGREEIIHQVRVQGREDRAFFVELYQVNRERDQQRAEAAQAFQQREAAYHAEQVPISLPLDYQRCNTLSERKNELKSFSNEPATFDNQPGPNPFLRASVAAEQPKQQAP